MRTLPYIMMLSTTTGYHSGKSTVAEAVCRCDRNARILSIAAPMKEMVILLLQNMGIPNSLAHEYVQNPNLKNKVIEGLGDGKVTPRRLMQTLGTEWRMMIDPLLWVKMALQRVDFHLQQGHNVVIDDMRFPEEELQTFRTYFYPEGVEVIHVNIIRPENALAQEDSHSSEGAFKDVIPDFEIVNNGTVQDLEETVKSLFFPNLISR